MQQQTTEAAGAPQPAPKTAEDYRREAMRRPDEEAAPRSVFERLRLMAGSLSNRLLTLTALWVTFIGLLLGYTVALGWQMEASSMTVNRLENMKTLVYRMNAAMDESTAPSTFDSSTRQFVEELRHLETGDDWQGFHFILVMPDPEQIAEIGNAWTGHILPLFSRARVFGHPVSAQKFDYFIGKMDRLQRSIESVRSSLYWQQRWIQLAIILLAVGSLFVIMALLLRWVIRPIETLAEGIRAVTCGNLMTRVDLEGGSLEFQRIGRGFNDMAGRLEDLVLNLEGKVAEKTAVVEEKNRNLAQLYEISTYLSRQHSVDEMCEGFASRLMHVSPASAVAVFLLNPKTNCLELAAANELPESLFAHWTAEKIDAEPLKDVLENDLPIRITADMGRDYVAELREVTEVRRFKTIYLFHARNGTKNIGLFALYFTEVTLLPEAVCRLYESFGAHLGLTVDNVRLIERDQQYAVVQERTLMAQGLHDSIAQSLSFLNLQVQLLVTGLKNKDEGLVTDTVEQIRTGVQECYEDVRELLLNFRERLHKENFAAALRTAIERFEMQTKLKVEISSHGRDPGLTDKEQLQVIFIVQEALANVRKHSHATDVKIAIESAGDFSVTVMDNGTGIDEKLLAERGKRHVGMNIMRERSEKIGAQVVIGPVDAAVFPHGTAVKLTLPAARLREVR